MYIYIDVHRCIYRLKNTKKLYLEVTLIINVLAMLYYFIGAYTSHGCDVLYQQYADIGHSPVWSSLVLIHYSHPCG